MAARHTDPDDDSFRRSLLRAVAGGLVAMVVTFAVTALLTVVGREDPDSGPVVSAPPPTTTEAATTPASPTSPPSSEPAPPTSEPTATHEPSATDPATDAATDAAQDVTVQVLDAAGTGTHAEDAAGVLRGLGYEVIVVNPTARRVQTTTILATPGSEAAAEALRDRDERFAEIDENSDFNPSVDLHILVGPDFS